MLPLNIKWQAQESKKIVLDGRSDTSGTFTNLSWASCSAWEQHLSASELRFAVGNFSNSTLKMKFIWEFSDLSVTIFDDVSHCARAVHIAGNHYTLVPSHSLSLFHSWLRPFLFHFAFFLLHLLKINTIFTWFLHAESIFFGISRVHNRNRKW